MSLTAAMILAFTALLSRWHLMLLAGKAWRGISKVHPEFAEALYTPGLDQVFYGLGPFRWTPLFRRPVPDDIRSTVRRLRVAAAINGALGMACLVYVPVAALYAARAG